MTLFRLCKDKAIADLLWTIGLFLIVLGPLSGTVRLWSAEGPVLIPAGSWVSAIGTLCAAFGVTSTYIAGGNKLRTALPSISPIGALISFIFIFLTDWISRPYSIIHGPEIRGGVLLFSGIIWTALTLGKEVQWFRWWLPIGALIVLFCFFDAANGRFIFSDDHSVVVYRLALLKENFPFIPFYNPLWNAGLDARDFFATGILNLYTMWWWLIALFDVRDVYNIIVGVTVFVIGPFLMWSALYIDGYKPMTRAVAALLSLATSLFWYRWCLKYGSMGFVTAILFVPFNFVFAKRLIFSEPIPRWLWIVSVATISWMLCWSLTGVIFIPVICCALFYLPTLFRQRSVRYFIGWLAVIDIPWIIIFISASNVFGFISLHQKVTAAPSTSEQIAAKTVVKGKVKKLTLPIFLEHTRQNTTPANVAILIFGLYGIARLQSKRLRLLFASQTIWLLLLGLFLSHKFPQLELDRMLIVLSFLLCLPAAALLTELVELLRSNPWKRALISIPLAYACVGVFSASAIMYNRSMEKFTFVDPVYYELGAIIKDNVQDGRAVFAGFVLHELNQGHLAPLMQETSAPLVASTLYHNVWNYTDLMPVSFRKRGPEGYEQYFDLMNASLVIAHERDWREYFYARPETYKHIGTVGVFNVFKRIKKSSYFIEGTGAVRSQTSNAVTLRMDSNDAVISFQYYPFLEVNTDSKCSIQQAPFFEELKLIQLTGCQQGTVVRISAKSGFRRLFS